MINAISVVKVRDILMVTMPMEPDDEIISQIQENVLSEMERFDVRGLVLDISLVDTLDSYFARTIMETAQMVELMGGRMVIAGMNPCVAMTATQLGLSLEKALTALSIDRALDMLNGVK